MVPRSNSPILVFREGLHVREGTRRLNLCTKCSPTYFCLLLVLVLVLLEVPAFCLDTMYWHSAQCPLQLRESILQQEEKPRWSNFSECHSLFLFSAFRFVFEMLGTHAFFFKNFFFFLFFFFLFFLPCFDTSYVCCLVCGVQCVAHGWLARARLVPLRLGVIMKTIQNRKDKDL